MSKYREMLRRYRLPDLPPVSAPPQVIRMVKHDIETLGRMGLVTLDHVGRVVALAVGGCTGCMACLGECPARALSIKPDTDPPTILLAHALCNGVACRRCEQICPSKVCHLNAFLISEPLRT